MVDKVVESMLVVAKVEFTAAVLDVDEGSCEEPSRVLWEPCWVNVGWLNVEYILFLWKLMRVKYDE